MPRFLLAEVEEWLAIRMPAERPAPPPRKKGLIYFIGAPEASPIKVGWTVRVLGRLQALQTSHWAELVCHGTIVGTQADEQAIHAALACHRIRGEWFERCPALEYLARHGAAERVHA